MDESIFDLSKKKKKKKPRDDATGAEQEGDENVSSEPAAAAAKEKKSKSVAFATESAENQENIGGEQAAAEGGDDDGDTDVLALRKKKKKKPTRDATGAAAGTAGDSEAPRDVAAGATGDDAGNDVTAVQGEYSYDDLLTRVFNIIRERNPNVVEGEKIKLTLKPPQVARIGTKRTSFSNFGEICRSLKRQEKHLHQYLLAELGTNGSIDANTALIIKGRFQQKQIESVLRSYIKEYVICKTCRSPDTLLQKEERLTVLFCNNCRSRYFASGIKTGFQAQVGRRAATRAKAT